jgi:hypothetical protein
MINIDIQYILIIFIVIIFFIFGLFLSEIIDFIFPDEDLTLPNYRIIIEIIGEICVVYLILYILKPYIKIIIQLLFNHISRPVPFYIKQVIFTAFTIGIYKHLQKYNNKITNIKEKFLSSDIINNISKYFSEYAQSYVPNIIK